MDNGDWRLEIGEIGDGLENFKKNTFSSLCIAVISGDGGSKEIFCNTHG
jgi:hypothetical protein